MAQPISFQSDALRLEGLWHPSPGARAVVVTHPHPLYGGDMHNAVVTAIADAFAGRGFATLRFNFRGTGASDGVYDDGPGEMRDLVAATQWVQSQTGTLTPPAVAGYSFGAWIAATATAAGQLQAVPLYLIAPPVAFISFADIAAPPTLEVVVAGSEDSFGPLPGVQALLERWQCEAVLEAVTGADHFFSGRLAEMAAALTRRIAPTTPQESGPTGP